MSAQDTVLDPPDTAELTVPTGGRVLVVADLLLGREETPATATVVAELAQTIDAWDGPGVVVFAGDLVDLLADRGATPAAVLAAHPRLTGALRAFTAAPDGNRHVLYLPGVRDARAGWDARARREIAEATGAEVAFAAELCLVTGRGERRVRVEAGARFDPRSAPTDPRSPTDTPLAHHVMAEVLPGLGEARATWLTGAERLADDRSLPRFIASRLVYRRVGRYAWLLLLPLVLALALKLPLSYAIAARADRALGPWTHRLALLAATTAVDILLLLLAITIVTRRSWTTITGAALGQRDEGANDAARAEARRLVTAGHAGLVIGHTRRAELTLLGDGFFAACGAAAEVVAERDGRLGLPSVFLPERRLSWVELEAGADLHARLLFSRVDTHGGSLVERAVARRHEVDDPRPRLVASYPGGDSWPAVADPAIRYTRVRRIAATVIAAAGLLDIASAITPPLRERLSFLLGIVPLAVPQAATALVALAGVALLLVARGIRRGQRRAWRIATGLLLGTVVLHVVKGVDIEEAVAAFVVFLYLIAHRDAFTAAVDRRSLRRGLAALALGIVSAIVVGTVALEVLTFRDRRIPLPTAIGAVSERLVGINSIALRDRINDFATPTLLAVGVALAAYAGILLFRPVVARRESGDSGLAKARDVVARYATGTLDYFALRTDKRFFFHGDTVVAYGVYSGVCLVSPDPIGPDAEADEAWAAFRRFADEQGWTLAVLGAGEAWLPVYRWSGMHDLYVGDEAVVDISRFSLEGGRNKSLRQAVNRVAKYGYAITFHDPADIDETLREQLRDVMTKSRRGDVERGFSMTLGRVFDPADKDLLLAVCHGPDGTPVAFCQYVPAPGIDGYSLDLMRRDDGEHPNGLLDFVVVRTIEHLREAGMRRLGLNFATMRAVLAGETGAGVVHRVERWALRRMSGSMQIESLWKFNAKFDPDWLPRYAVYDSPEHVVPVALAIARAESFWELPLIGRFLVPDELETAGT